MQHINEIISKLGGVSTFRTNEPKLVSLEKILELEKMLGKKFSKSMYFF